MYYMTGGSKQAFAPFEYPSHLHQQPNQFPYASPFFSPQQMMYPPMQTPPFPAYKINQRPPIMKAFLKQDGTFDFEKTFQTVHQISSTIQHVSPLVKQVSSFFKVGK